MFSFFNDGIRNTHPQEVIYLQELVNIIKNNPNKNKIEKIRLLKRAGDEHYIELKKELSNITPNCVVKIRDLDGEKFLSNFILSSGYIFFDIDNLPDVVKSKKDFIKKYGNQVSLVCISSGGDGLSILFKVENIIKSKEQFNLLRDKIKNTILKDISIDVKCNDIGRAMFVSYDPEVYVNYDNKIKVNISNTSKPKKSINQSITRRKSNNRLKETFSIISIEETLEKICLKTRVDVKNPVVDVIPVEYAMVSFPRIITDGNKHRIYTGIIHSLVYLNPEVKVDYLFSYLHFINNNYADPSMEFREFTRLFNTIYSSIKNNNYDYKGMRTKYVHFNHTCDLTGEEKRNIAIILNGHRRKNESINKIIKAKQELAAQGQKITQKNIATISGLSLSTVKRHYNSKPVDLNEVISKIENEILTRDNTSNSIISLNNSIQEDNVYPRIIEPNQYLFPPQDEGNKSDDNSKLNDDILITG